MSSTPDTGLANRRPSRQPSSFFDQVVYPSSSDGAVRADENADFVAFISAVSKMYTRRPYLDMSKLDLTQNDRKALPLGSGSVFMVKSVDVTYDIPSKTKFGELDTVDNSVVSKTTPVLFDADGSPFDSTTLRAVIMEIRILSHAPLYWHPNIITMLGVGWHFEQFLPRPTAQPQLVLELAEGTLEEFLGNNNELPFRTRCEIGLGIANGLAALHSCGIVHGDIKPSNILMVPSYSAEEALGNNSICVPKIADFSHSFVDSGRPRRMGGGTRGFMAPEILAGEMVLDCKATDVYSFGVTLWRLFFPGVSFPSGGSTNAENDWQDATFAAVLAAIDSQLGTTIAASSRRRLLHSIMDSTVSPDPAARKLDLVRESLLPYTEESEIHQKELQYRR